MKLRTVVVLLPVLALAACARCGKPGAGPSDIQALVPKEAEAIVVVPDVGRLGERLRTLETLKVANFLAQLQGFGSGTDLVSSLMQQLGVDLRSREALEQAGVDPGRGLALIAVDPQRAYSIVATQDPARFRKMLTTLARDRLGAGEVASRSENGLKITTFSRGGAPVAELVELDRFVLVGAGPIVGSLAARARPADGASLEDDPAFTRGSARLPSDRDLVAYVPGGSRRGAQAGVAGTVATARIQDDAIRLNFDVPWPNTKSALDALQKQAGATSRYELLADDAFAVLRFAGDPVALDLVWPHVVGIRLSDRLREAGFSVKDQVLSNLKPGAVVALSLAPTMTFSGGAPNLNVRQSNPIRYVNVTAATEVKDAALAQQMLDALPKLNAQLGAQVTRTEQDGRAVYLTRYSQGEGLHFALVGDRLLAAAPQGRLMTAVAAAEKPAGDGQGQGLLTDEAWRKALEAEAVGFVVDLHRLAAAVEALPSSAWGVGGFAIKASTLRWLEATRDLRAITGSVSTRDGAIQAELALRIVRE